MANLADKLTHRRKRNILEIIQDKCIWNLNKADSNEGFYKLFILAFVLGFAFFIQISDDKTYP